MPLNLKMPAAAAAAGPDLAAPKALVDPAAARSPQTLAPARAAHEYLAADLEAVEGCARMINTVAPWQSQ